MTQTLLDQRLIFWLLMTSMETQNITTDSSTTSVLALRSQATKTGLPASIANEICCISASLELCLSESEQSPGWHQGNTAAKSRQLLVWWRQPVEGRRDSPA